MNSRLICYQFKREVKYSKILSKVKLSILTLLHHDTYRYPSITMQVETPHVSYSSPQTPYPEMLHPFLPHLLCNSLRTSSARNIKIKSRLLAAICTVQGGPCPFCWGLHRETCSVTDLGTKSGLHPGDTPAIPAGRNHGLPIKPLAIPSAGAGHTADLISCIAAVSHLLM